MASNIKDTEPATNQDWLGVIEQDTINVISPRGVLKEKPLSCFERPDQELPPGPPEVQVNLEPLPQSFEVTT